MLICKEGQEFEPRRTSCTLRLKFEVLTPQMGIFQRQLRVIGLVRPGKAAPLDIFPELPDGLDTGLSQGGVLSDKLGHGLRQEAQEVVQYHDLSVAVTPGPDPDCGYG